MRRSIGIRSGAAWACAALGLLAAGAALAGEPRAPRAKSYVGVHIGISERELQKRVKLPPELEQLAAIHFASGARVVTARQADALLLLLTDDRGVVTDQVDLPGAARTKYLSPGCEQGDADVLIGLVPADAPPGVGPAERAWNERGGKFVEVAGKVECFGPEPEDRPPSGK
ncbi:MAG TPA: hypothetical protein PK668_21475 [Myxococcota bacterium]|nr:hypothetical protein [Myxococcota bacterium]HRY96048.1 hypothetical protein [Myxococcota bacterium]HSA21854.1 hypothetical protein [Myxococcota bacterium]